MKNEVVEKMAFKIAAMKECKVNPKEWYERQPHWYKEDRRLDALRILGIVGEEIVLKGWYQKIEGGTRWWKADVSPKAAKALQMAKEAKSE